MQLLICFISEATESISVDSGMGVYMKSCQVGLILALIYPV
jgi:hypothetical protein